MMLSTRSALLLLVVLAVPALMASWQTAPTSFAMAQEDDGEDLAVEDVAVEEDVVEGSEDVNEDELTSHSHISTSVVFLDHSDLKFPAGSVVTALVGVQNNADTTILVKEIQGAIRSGMDHGTIFQNLTAQPVELGLETEHEISFLYRFMPSRAFEPSNFGLTIEVHYEDGQNTFFDAPFNSTIQIVDSETTFTPQEVMSYVTFVALGVLAYLLYFKPASSDTPVTSSSNKPERGTASTDDEWLEGTHAVNQTKSNKKRTKSTSKD